MPYYARSYEKNTTNKKKLIVNKINQKKNLIFIKEKKVVIFPVNWWSLFQHLSFDFDQLCRLLKFPATVADA